MDCACGFKYKELQPIAANINTHRNGAKHSRFISSSKLVATKMTAYFPVKKKQRVAVELSDLDVDVDVDVDVEQEEMKEPECEPSIYACIQVPTKFHVTMS